MEEEGEGMEEEEEGGMEEEELGEGGGRRKEEGEGMEGEGGGGGGQRRRGKDLVHHVLHPCATAPATWFRAFCHLVRHVLRPCTVAPETWFCRSSASSIVAHVPQESLERLASSLQLARPYAPAAWFWASVTLVADA